MEVTRTRVFATPLCVSPVWRCTVQERRSAYRTEALLPLAFLGTKPSTTLLRIRTNAGIVERPVVVRERRQVDRHRAVHARTRWYMRCCFMVGLMPPSSPGLPFRRQWGASGKKQTRRDERLLSAQCSLSVPERECQS